MERVRLRERWPLVNYAAEFKLRGERIARLRVALAEERITLASVKEYYRTRPIEWIEHWGVTYDPRNAGTGVPVYLPFILFKKQKELVTFIYECLANQTSGLIEKSRDMGVTWVAVGVANHLWTFRDGASIGFGSYGADKVDKIGDADSIFEKIRMYIRWVPEEFHPAGFIPKEHMSYMKVVNPETGATIVGGVGDNIGRGGRKTAVFKDESAHYEHPEAVESALMANTSVQIDMSSVYGLGTVFHRKREAGVDWIPGRPVSKTQTNVFVFDWRDHPGKSEEWYQTQYNKHSSEGTLHLLRQEVDRDYAGAVQGVIIKPEHVRAAIDAHVKLAWPDEGNYCAGLDVADEGGDTNVLVVRRGVILRNVDEWGEGDVGETARRAIAICKDYPGIVIEYDSIGVGAGVKSEHNRLVKAGEMPKRIKMVPWNAGGAVQGKEEYLIKNDKQSPLKGDFYANLGAQAAWDLRLRFERTFNAITKGHQYPIDDMISIDSKLPLLRKIEKELSQPTIGHSTTFKLIVNKKPDGAKSPNIFDAIKKCYFPVKGPEVPLITDDMMARVAGQLNVRRYR